MAITPIEVHLSHTDPGADSERNTGVCLVCNGRLGLSRLPGLKECESCGFVTADLALSDEELSCLYDKDYFHGAEYHNYTMEEESLRSNFRRRIEILKSLEPDLASKEIFEIGCAYGYFLNEVRSCVRHASGIDISNAAVLQATKLQSVEAYQGDYLAFQLRQKVDLIAMFDTIEHLQRPDLYVEKVAADLRPGGLFAITTGDISSIIARVRGKSWRMIHPPTHLHYFSAATLTKLLERHGFEVAHLSHPGNMRNLRSVLHFILALKMKRPAVFDRLKGFKILDLRITANLFDIMYVVARRKAA
jgi:SAM-dependent methyltransferase